MTKNAPYSWGNKKKFISLSQFYFFMFNEDNYHIIADVICNSISRSKYKMFQR